MIPKIIHFTAPKEKERWHPIWDVCYESWKNCFDSNEFEIILWDHETIDDYVKNSYSEYWDIYQNIPLHIMKLDFFRYCVLHDYGGIYSDMDVYCYKNFHENLTDDAYVLENNPSGYSSSEYILNSLMCSSPKNIFFGDCIQKSIENYLHLMSNEKFKKVKSHTDLGNNTLIRASFGPYFLSRYVENTSHKIFLLPYKIYNNHMLTYSEDYVTKHMLTGMWGKEILFLASKDELKEDHRKFRGVNSDTFDFKKNYR